MPNGWNLHEEHVMGNSNALRRHIGSFLLATETPTLPRQPLRSSSTDYLSSSQRDFYAPAPYRNASGPKRRIVHDGLPFLRCSLHLRCGHCSFRGSGNINIGLSMCLSTRIEGMTEETLMGQRMWRLTIRCLRSLAEFLRTAEKGSELVRLVDEGDDCMGKT
ncbi:uncharacterized protein EI97DRAFT_58315 [Westerdykella ornata]|uniref:Uncharacterized protein n=1 Tax=Westerdykella ornata TaxID=318751 RepID=A0A6A6JHH0_WESOR|nr:uncharacterized protein EI97DRAFT_58315 [Westerdykella ornata]KAF2275852.1 hypothetical protein EI97DRAFT_58315 [Westerdykella ornata]